ncbi:MAG: hypothetical protein LQ342_005519 [Letrouitia transgressa]|nr:MAG: hypothetical protein LQ342_005519 [Letrouitia transgressa]
MLPSSPWSIKEAEPPKWQPREDLAASAFVGMTFLLVLEINVEILRVFKKRKGLYFWSMSFGTLGCLIDAVGVILKYLSHGTTDIWPLYTLFLLSGWTMYAPLQLMVLYSRLHLVIESRKVQRFVLIMILFTIPVFIIPTWIVVWPAYNPDPPITDRWSPPDAIVERYTQLGFTLVECIISGVYIYSLLGLLRYKSTVRQRRVFYDLIYVNIITVAFDILTVVLVYLNQLGTSHPIQAFSYALKLRLEFVVLNQLMAVAARGVRRETFEEKRYHHPSTSQNTSEWDNNFLDTRPSAALRKPCENISTSSDGTQKGATQISMPKPVIEAAAARSTSGQHLPYASFDHIKYPHSRGESPSNQRATESLMQALRRTVRPHSGHSNTSRRGSEAIPIRIRRKSSSCDTEDEEEEEIGLHMWENRGDVVLEVPWFRRAGSAV